MWVSSTLYYATYIQTILVYTYKRLNLVHCMNRKRYTHFIPSSLSSAYLHVLFIKLSMAMALMPLDKETLRNNR